MTKLAHISDVHLAPLPGVTLRELMSKRITGYANWVFNRSRYMQRDTMAELVAHMQQRKPDAIAVTGDLVNLSARSEFLQSIKWLEKLGPAQKVCAIPGNHDAYVPGALDTAKRIWGPYMQGETLNGADFPFVRRIDEVALIGCSSAQAMPPFVAAGELGPAQIDRLARTLSLLGEAGFFRVVLIHHPPAGPKSASQRMGLRDAAAVRSVIADKGAELVLHGHLHEATVNAIPGRTGEIPVLGVAAASANAQKGEQPARYNLFNIERVATGWSCTLREYGYQRIGDEIVLRLKMRLY